MAFNFKVIFNPIVRKLFEDVFNTSTGHDHDGANSKAITVGTVADDSITNAKVKSNAAIAWSKFATSTDINTSGEVTDLTISGEVNGDVLYFDGANWVRKAATALPAATSSSLADSVNIDGGANDVILVNTTQTVGTSNLTIPDFANVDQTLATTELAQVFKNKTLDDATTKFGDTADPTKDLFFSLGGATADKTMTITSSHTDDRALTLPDATDTLVGKTTTDTFTNKTLTDTTCVFGANGALTKVAKFDLSGATAGKTATLTSSHTDDRVITLPDATDTLVGKATSDTFTNKTYDAKGSGNVLSNVNANNLDPITGNNYGIPFIIPYTLSNQAAAVDIYTANAPFKFQIIKAWSISTSADGGTWKLNNGTLGGGTDITNAVTVAASADDFDEPTDYTLSEGDIAQNGSLSIVPDGAGLLDCVIYIMAMRID